MAALRELQSDDMGVTCLRILWYRRRMIAAVLGFALTAGLANRVHQRVLFPRYRAHSTVTMLPSYAEIAYASRRSDFPGQNPALILTQTQTEYLLSRSTAERLVQQLVDDGWIKRPDGSRSRDSAAASSPQTKHASFAMWRTVFDKTEHHEWDILVERMHRGIRVRNVPGSFILNISVTWSDPDVAQVAANMLADIHVKNTQLQNQRSLALSREYIEQRIGQLNGDLREAEARIRDYKTSSSVYLSLVSETPMQIKQLEEYAQQKSKLEVRALELYAQLTAARTVRPFTDTVPLHAEYQATREALNRISELMESRRRTLQRVPGMEYELTALEQQRDDIRQRIEILQNSLAQAAAAEATYLQTVRVIDPATRPVRAAGLGWVDGILVWAAAGLLLALGLVAVREPFRRKMLSHDDAVGLPFDDAGIVPVLQNPGLFSVWGRFQIPQAATVARHAADAAMRLSGPGPILLATVNGASRHRDELLAILRQAPTTTLVVNLDRSFHEELSAARRLPRTASAGGDETTPVWLFEKHVRYVAMTQEAASASVPLHTAAAVFIRTQAASYAQVVVIAPPVRESALGTELQTLAAQLILLARADEDSVRDIRIFAVRHCTQRSAGLLLTGVSFPLDFRFA